MGTVGRVEEWKEEGSTNKNKQNQNEQEHKRMTDETND